MTGGGRCQRRRKSMAGGRGAAESKKVERNIKIPNLKPEITEKPSGSPKIWKVPPTCTVELDLYTQACKVLSFRSPFDSEDSQGPPAFVSSANTLPSGVSNLLSRHSDSRKRQKKLHPGSEKKSFHTGGTTRGRNIWIEAEEYFREFTVQDVERLDKLPSVGFSSDEKCFLIPSLKCNGNLCDDMANRMLRGAYQKDSLKQDNDNGAPEINGTSVQEGSGAHSMGIDGDEEGKGDLGVIEESHGDKKPSSYKDSVPFSGVEWLLGSRSKIYLATERPSKKRKLCGRDAGLEKLHTARPVEGVESVCHYCNYGYTGDPLNCLIKCTSCCMVVHQRCYGVQEDVDSSWLCTWCKYKDIVGLNREKPCLLCPKQGGALKPVRRSGNDESKMEFAHLFCSQWLPELYLENTRAMEPIMNVDELTDTRRKLICYLCKVKFGACVRCSNGSCRTPFHPICAREARHRMEIWGKLGTDEVELRAFCSKHSEVEDDSGSQVAVDISLTAEQDRSKQNDVALDGEELPDCKRKSEIHQQNGDASHLVTNCSVDRNDSDSHDCPALNFMEILKKLIDIGKVNAKDIASGIGVSLDSLDSILTGSHLVPELQCKLLRWLKNHVANLQKLKVKTRSPVTPKAVVDAAEGVGAVSVEESSISDSVPVKSVPPRRRTKGSMRPVKDDKSEEPLVENSNDLSEESFPDDVHEVLIDLGQHQDSTANNSIKIEDDLTALVQSLSEDSLVREAVTCHQMASSSVLILGEVKHASYLHPLIHRKLMHIKNDVLDPSADSSQLEVASTSGCCNNHNQQASSGDQTARCDGLNCDKVVKAKNPGLPELSPVGTDSSQLEVVSSSGCCCNNHNQQASSGDQTARCDGVNCDQLVKARNLGLLELSPVDEVEGQLIYYQQQLLNNAVSRKCISDKLISKVVRSLTPEVDTARKRKWDDVLVSQYIHDLREAKKQGRKERRHKEAQAVLAAATAAAASSSRVSSIRKDNLEESSPQRNKESTSRPTVVRFSFETNSDSVRSASNDQPRTCDVCRRSDTVLNPILVCSICKVAVHLDCYRSVRSTAGPWHCELCEDLFSSKGSENVLANTWDEFVAECCLCGGTAGAFRKSVDGQWIHAFCAEWVLESTYRRGQLNPIDGMDNVSKGIDTCTVCHHKQGFCLKCSYGHCQTAFHPTCARSAGFYMTVKTNGGKLQHKAYCEKHSVEQRAKAETQKHGVDELKCLKQIRVELERLRLLCERIVKREKLKRELALCSQSILASSRDSVLSALAHHPYYQPEISSESATTSIKGYTDDYKSGSEIVQRSEDITVDSAVAGKRRVKIPLPVDNDQKTEDSSTSQNLYTLKPVERPTLSGKHIPQRHLQLRPPPPSDKVEKQSKHRKVSVTFRSTDAAGRDFQKEAHNDLRPSIHEEPTAT